MIYKYSKIIKYKTFYDSMDLFSMVSHLYDIKIDFVIDEFKNFLNNIYSIYEYHNEIYKYRDDMQKFLVHSIVNKIENKNNNKLKIEDLLDSIWEVKTSKDSNTLGNKDLHKIMVNRRIRND